MKSRTLSKSSLAIFSLASLMSITACNGDTATKTSTDSTISTTVMDTATKSTTLKPMMPKPDWGKGMSDEMATVIEKLASYKAPPIVKLSAPEARMQPSPATAVMDLMKEHNIPMPPSNVDTMGKEIPVAGGNIHLRIYTPKTGKASYPVIVYYHGGGWVIADINTYDASSSGLANQAEAVVVSVNYRQGPEHKFPTAHNDCFAAYEWAMKNVASIKGDPKKIALVGESAGGNLAAAVSMMARNKKMPLPIYEVLVYPIAGYDFTTPSYKSSDSTKPLNTAMMHWFFDKYLNSPADGKSPMISLVTANLAGLPPTTIIGAEYDPLMSEGKMLSDNLSKAGVKTNYKMYSGTTHEFFGMATVVPDAKDAQALAVSDLKSAFK